MPQAIATPTAVPTAAPRDERERYYVRNLALLTTVETGWGFGMAFGFSASFIQVVLRNLGASQMQIGLLAAQWGIGTIPMVLAGYFTGHLRRKKSVVFWGHCACVLPVAALAAALAFVPSNPAKVWCVLAAEYGFGVSVGLLIPIWLTFMGKVMPPGKLGSGFGITFFFQTLAGFGAGQLAAWILSVRPDAVPHCVLATAVAMAIANFFFIPVREPETEAEDRPAAFGPFLRQLFAELRANPRFRALLAADVLFSAQYGVVGFYAARAADFGASNAAGATFTSVVALAQSVSALAGGWAVDRLGPRVVSVAGRLAVVAAAVFAWRASSVAGLIPAAICVGAFWGVRSAGNFALFREVTGKEEVTSLLGLFTLLVAPFAAAVPLVAAAGLDRHAWSAPAMFLVCGGFSLLSALLLALGVRRA